MFLLFHRLSRFAIAFLPRSKSLLISCPSDFGPQENTVGHYFLSLCLLWVYSFSTFWRSLIWANLGFEKITGCWGKSRHKLKMRVGEIWGSGERWVDSGGALEAEMTRVSDHLWVGATRDNSKFLVWEACWLGMPFIELGTLTRDHPQEVETDSSSWAKWSLRCLWGIHGEEYQVSGWVRKFGVLGRLWGHIEFHGFSYAIGRKKCIILWPLRMFQIKP